MDDGEDDERHDVLHGEDDEGEAVLVQLRVNSIEIVGLSSGWKKGLSFGLRCTERGVRSFARF